jgi:hypothetical protein
LQHRGVNPVPRGMALMTHHRAIVATLCALPMMLPTVRPAHGRELTPASAQPERRYDRLAPFEAVKWNGDEADVLVSGEWGQLASIDGVGVAEILAFCRKTWPPDFTFKRFEEDLVEVLSLMGHPPKETVRLVMSDAEGMKREMDAVMTEENRRRLRQAGTTRDLRVAPATLSRAQGEDAVRQAAALMASSHSYSNLSGEPVDEARLRAAMSMLGEKNAPSDVEAAIFSLIAPTGDGHAGVRAMGMPEAGPFLPILPVPIGGGTKVAAVKPDRSALMDAEHPYLVAIEGVDLSRWLDAAKATVAAGSAQMVMDRSCRRLRSVADLAPRVGQKAKAAGEMLRITLADEKGKTKDIEVRLDPRKPEFGMWPRTASRVIEREGSRIGYLRVPEMDAGDEFEREIVSRLEEFEGCRGLIIDVRGNGGGRRDIINIVCPRLLAPGAAPVVYNASRPLKLPGDDVAKMDGRLSTRFLFRADDGRWSEAERRAIAAFSEQFKPEVALRDDRFGAWYLAAVSPAPDATERISTPVVVLMDARCFSATDVFLAAMSRMPGVTLMGEPSSGGSGLTRPHEIKVAANGPGERERRFEIALSTMVSFTPEGKLFDRRGIEPHVVVPATPEFYTAGGADVQLEAALKRLMSP